jgi:hypothetical protein
VFWRAASMPSINAVLELERAVAKEKGLLLAINDGDPADVAARTAATHKFTAIVVTDPSREISAGYGIRMWPTVLSIDSFGVVSSLRYARMDNRSDGTALSGTDG